MKGCINVSVVLYESDAEEIHGLIDSCLKSHLVAKVFLIDNSGNSEYFYASFDNNRVVYIYNDANIGFGRGHNIAIRRSIESGVKYHMILNPDVKFDPSVISFLYSFMEKHTDVGLLMPKILNPDGTIQTLCKLLPTPFDLIGRRFLNVGFLKQFLDKRNEVYELRFTGYKNVMEVPSLSGCFMFVRLRVLERIGFFDERFFLYCSDVDLSRRIHEISRTVFYPRCWVVHRWRRGSYEDVKLLFYHIIDAIKYFNKWGWLRDDGRKVINKRCLEKLGMKQLKWLICG